MAKETDPQIKELVFIRKLLVLGLLRDGLTQTQVAGALDLDRSAISRMFPKGTLTGIAKREKSDE
jgi:predicted transcriptional regulator